MVFALCGGDERIARLASMLVEDGHGVRAWALEDAPLAEGVRECASADECISGAHCVVLPMPLTARRGFLNAPFSKRPRCLGEVFTAVRPGSLVCAGGVTAEARELAEECGARLADYGALESFRAVNSLATAEGAIGVLLRETPEVICGRSAVIIGAGRITRALSPRLAARGRARERSIPQRGRAGLGAGHGLPVAGHGKALRRPGRRRYSYKHRARTRADGLAAHGVARRRAGAGLGQQTGRHRLRRRAFLRHKSAHRAGTARKMVAGHGGKGGARRHLCCFGG